MSVKAYRYRIYANKATTEKLEWTLDRARELYNAGLQERRDAYEATVKRHPNYYNEELRKNDDFLDNPRYYRRAEKKLKQLQQALSRKKRGSHRRAKAVKAVTKAHKKIQNQREDFLHKHSRKLVNRYQVIVFEDLQTANLVKRPQPKQDEETGKYLPNGAAAKAGLNKSISDAGWTTFVQYCTYKAAWAGRAVVQVDPKYTSQICSGCGTIRKKPLEERWHSCECGCELDRNTNAALNILNLGYKTLLGRGASHAGNCVEAPGL